MDSPIRIFVVDILYSKNMASELEGAFVWDGGENGWNGDNDGICDGCDDVAFDCPFFTVIRMGFVEYVLDLMVITNGSIIKMPGCKGRNWYWKLFFRDMLPLTNENDEDWLDDTIWNDWLTSGCCISSMVSLWLPLIVSVNEMVSFSKIDDRLTLDSTLMSGFANAMNGDTMNWN